MLFLRWKRFSAALVIIQSVLALTACGGGGEDGDSDFTFLAYEEPVTQTATRPVSTPTAKYYDLSKSGLYAATSGYTKAFNRQEILDQVWSQYPLDRLAPFSELSISPKSSTVETFLGRQANVSTLLRINKSATGVELSRSTSKRYIEVGSNTVLGTINSSGNLSIAGARSGSVPRYAKPGEGGFLGTDLVYADVNKSRLLSTAQVFWALDEEDGYGIICYSYIDSNNYISPSMAFSTLASTPVDQTCTLIDSDGNPSFYVRGRFNSTGKYRYAARY